MSFLFSIIKAGRPPSTVSFQPITAANSLQSQNPNWAGRTRFLLGVDEFHTLPTVSKWSPCSSGSSFADDSDKIGPPEESSDSEVRPSVLTSVSTSLCVPRSCHPDSRSSIVALNRKTPSILPCGQPPVTGRGSDMTPPTLTVMVLFVRNVATNLSTSVDAPFLARAQTSSAGMTFY